MQMRLESQDEDDGSVVSIPLPIKDLHAAIDNILSPTQLACIRLGRALCANRATTTAIMMIGGLVLSALFYVSASGLKMVSLF